jgi:trk system potassium uptake protein TrkH
MLGVLHLLSQALGWLAFAMLFPALIALVAEDRVGLEGFLLVAGLTGFIAGAIFFALRGRRWRLSRSTAFIFVVAMWTVPALIAAVPIMYGASVSYVSALFEAISGLTTTGASVMPSIDHTGSAIIFWRAELQWLGGLMTLISMVALLAPAGVGGLTGRVVASLGPAGEVGLGRSFSTVRTVAIMYTVGTGICLALLILSGIPAFDAVCLAFATVSTGGFMPVEGGFGVYRNAFAEVVVMIFMLVGATSVVWHRMILQGRWTLLLAHRESYWVIGVAVLLGIAYGAAFSAAEGGLAEPSAFNALRDGLFTGISIVSTTGFEPMTGAIAALPVAVVAALALAGGGAMSTAGGIKYFRFGGMFVQSMHELKRLVYPHSVRNTHFGSQPYDISLMKSLWASAIAALAVVTLSTLLLTLNHPSFHGGALAAISAFANIGPLYPAEWEASVGWPTYADFDGFSQVVMIVTMVVGRIEAVAVLALFSVAYWRS